MKPLATVILLALGACRMPTGIPIVAPGPDPVLPEGYVVVDLTRPLDRSAPFVPHPEASPFERVEFAGPRAYGWRTGVYSGLEHMGTHVAAPLARQPGADPMERLDPARLVLPLAVVDLPTSARDGGVLTAVDLAADEKAHGPIPAGSVVLLRTGCGALAAGDPALLGRKPGGALAFPGWAEDAVRVLAAERRVRAIGTDGPAIDCGAQVVRAPAQSAGSRSGLWFVVGLADLSKLPPRGATLFIGALPIVGAAGAPARVVALVPSKSP
jgi:kynurenine formamidase